MTSIQLRKAAKFFKEQPHQLAAWDWLESRLAPADLEEFASMYRGGPEIKRLTAENSWDGVLSTAQRAGAVHPELVAAQWALESDWGRATPPGSNNYFGLKGAGTGTETKEFINGQWITITDSFLNFPDLATCIVYLIDRWYRDWGKYKGCNNCKTRNEAAQWLVHEGYATDPGYATKLINLMDANAPVNPIPKPTPQNNPLKVPYFSQRDSAVAGAAQRMCFSSSCAMLVAALKPGAISGPNADDQYLQRVYQFGDTTDATAQLRALRSYGITARFVQDADWADIERSIQLGIPVPCGFLHHGTSSAPTGAGHWLTVIGYTKSAVIVNDPWGEMDVVSGNYLNAKGGGLAYSRKNWGPRWLVEGANSGWAIIAKP